MCNAAVGCLRYFDRVMSEICAVFERSTSSGIWYIYDTCRGKDICINVHIIIIVIIIIIIIVIILLLLTYF